MIANRPDWCISRQRAWGVPIAVFYCAKCNALLAEPRLVEHVASLMDHEGADVWFARSATELVPPGTTCAKCGAREFTKESDILDVWFDSGVSQAAVLRVRPDQQWPADLYLEGSDQHRGWFHSSLLAAVGVQGGAPYKAVLTHGFVVDGEGRKMSKSQGNVIAPQEVIGKYGAEVLRLWVAAEDYRDDIRLSEEILTRLAEGYRRIRNTCRYLLGNLYDFEPGRDTVPVAHLLPIDRFILHRLQRFIERVRRAYEDYEFHVLYHGLHNFCAVDLSAFYLDVLKDRVYTAAPTSRLRRSAQTAMHEILVALVKLMAPVLSFTADEVWRYLPLRDKPASVHLTEFPTLRPELLDEALAGEWDRLLATRDVVLRGLEAAPKRKAHRECAGSRGGARRPRGRLRVSGCASRGPGDHLHRLPPHAAVCSDGRHRPGRHRAGGPGARREVSALLELPRERGGRGGAPQPVRAMRGRPGRPRVSELR